MGPPRVEARRRLAASLSLSAVVVGAALVVVGLRGQLVRVVASLLALVVMTLAGWFAVTRRGVLRTVAIVVALATVAVLGVLVLSGRSHGLLLVGELVLVGTSAGLTRYALRRDRRSLRMTPVPGTPVGPASHGVLIINPNSGGGKATRSKLADEARQRGVEPIVMEPGVDLRQLAEDAVANGADVIGMAGGDGSQALVASVAMRDGVALVCVPAGTRNHFALDLGLDRDDVVGALDAFGDAVERRIDLGEVGGRVFVNNVSLGVYAKIVQSPGYRDAKRQTTAAMLPELLGPDAAPSGMRFSDGAGTVHDGAQIIQVSNNPYELARLSGFGTRARLDTGTLGVSAVEVRGVADVTELLAAETAGQVRRFRGWTEFTSPTFTVESAHPVEAGIDGEASLLDPPVEFRCLPGAVRVRIPGHAPGYSPAALAAPSIWWTLVALLRTVAGRPTPIDESQR